MGARNSGYGEPERVGNDDFIMTEFSMNLSRCAAVSVILHSKCRSNSRSEIKLLVKKLGRIRRLKDYDINLGACCAVVTDQATLGDDLILRWQPSPQ